MGWKWKDALSGFTKGAMTSNPYMAVAGGAVGGFSQDIDKGVTGNSNSGMTQGLLSLGTGGFGGGTPSGSFGEMGGGAGLPKGAGISFPSESGWMDGGVGGNGGVDDYSKIMDMFNQFRQQRPTDTSDPNYDPLAHAGYIKSKYPFIPDQSFQSWLKDQKSSGGYQIVGNRGI